MDVVLEFCDTFIFDPIYASLFPAQTPGFAPNGTFSSMKEVPTGLPTPAPVWQFEPASQYISVSPGKYAYMSQLSRDDWRRQLVSLFFITWFFGVLVYFLLATLSYVFVFDKSTVNHPRYLKNQIRMEIKQANISMPIMAVMTAPIFLLEVRGYAKLYDTWDEAPFWWYNILQVPFFLVFSDFLIYWIHRYLHHPLIYKYIHKPHHKWIMPTPFASHAFHPLDGQAQGMPYYLFPFMFPLQKMASVFFFIFVNVWTVLIHDGEYVANNPIINGAACHTMHHLYFNFNYGQYTTVWDRLGGSYRKPNDELFKKDLKMSKNTWQKQAKDVDAYVNEVEGSDERHYTEDEPKKVK